MLTVIKLIFLLIGFSSATNGILIKYEAIDYDNSTAEFTEEAIINQKNVSTIKVLEELPLLRKGMLQINASTALLHMTNIKLTEIEPEAFDGQNITEVIGLGYNELTMIRSRTFRNLTILFLCLIHNKISHIEDEAISDMPNLFAINLSGNKIVHINVNSFINIPKLRGFFFTFNEVTKLDAKNFDFMAKDHKVFVIADDNRITEIHPKTFDGMVNFRGVFLNDNNLTHVPADIWTASIEMLSLTNNQFEELPEAFYSSNISFVNLTGNPLKCDVQEKLKEVKTDNKTFFEFDDNCLLLDEMV